MVKASAEHRGQVSAEDESEKKKEEIDLSVLQTGPLSNKDQYRLIKPPESKVSCGIIVYLNSKERGLSVSKSSDCNLK